jgi:hypothetical protein
MLRGCSSSLRQKLSPSVPPSSREGELSAAVELRRLFPGVTDMVEARECARTIAGWEPLIEKPGLVRLPGKRR